MLLYAYLSRVVCFALALLIFPRRIIPLSVRLSFVVVVVIFYSPLWLRESFQGANSIAAGSFINWQQLLVEGMIGLSAALFMMGFVFVGILLARWFGQLLFVPSTGQDRLVVRESSAQLLEGVIVFYILLMLNGAGFFSRAFSSFGEVMVSVPLSVSEPVVSAQVLSTPMLFDLVRMIGSIAIQQAFFLALPVFSGIFLVDIFYVVANRFVRRLATSELVLTTKLPAVVLLLAALMYPFSDRIAQLCLRQVEQGRMTKLFSIEDPMRGTVLKAP